MTAPTSQEPEACLHFHALFLDTQLDVVWSPGLGRRIRAGLARLVGGPMPHPTSDVPARVPEEKGVAR